MIFQGGFMVFHGFWLVSMVFQGGFMVLWFLVGFHGFSGWFHGFSCFFDWFPWFFKVVSWFLWIMVGFHGFVPQNCILAQQSSLGLAGRRPALA